MLVSDIGWCMDGRMTMFGEIDVRRGQDWKTDGGGVYVPLCTFPQPS